MQMRRGWSRQTRDLSRVRVDSYYMSLLQKTQQIVKGHNSLKEKTAKITFGFESLCQNLVAMAMYVRPL